MAWETVCRPKELGGLGVADLRRVGITLRVRWEWQDRTTQHNTAQRSQLGSTDRAARAIFQAATVLTLGNGHSIFFWTDRWLDGWTVKEIAPLIIASVGSRKRGATVAEALHNHNWMRHITAPLTMQVLLEFDKLYDKVERFSLSDARHLHLDALT